MHIDLYTKSVLTVIAVSLSLIAVRPYIVAPSAEAQSGGVVDVRIRGIDEASNLRWEAIRVICENCR